METYVYRRHNTVTQFIVTIPFMDLCLATEWRPGSRVENILWDQDGLYLKGIHKASREAEGMEGEEETDITATETG